MVSNGDARTDILPPNPNGDGTIDSVAASASRNNNQPSEIIVSTSSVSFPLPSDQTVEDDQTIDDRTVESDKDNSTPVADSNHSEEDSVHKEASRCRSELRAFSVLCAKHKPILRCELARCARSMLNQSARRY